MSAEGPAGDVTANRDIVAGYVANVINVYHQAAPEPPGLTDEAFTRILTDYLHWVPDFYGQARLFGGPPKQRELRDVFTPFTLRRFSPSRDMEARLDDEAGDDALGRMKAHLRWEDERRDKGNPVATKDLLLEGDRLAVVGGAGSGKSTLLAHVACELARMATTGLPCAFALSAAKDPQTKPTPQPPIPLLVPLRLRRQYLKECTNTVGKAIDDPGHGRLRGFIPWALARQSDRRFGSVGDLVDRLLRGGAFLLMLDGLDEVVDSRDRANVRQEIEDLVRTYGNTRLIVTARAAGYRERAVFPDRWTRLDVQPLDAAQVSFLVGRWCRELYPVSEQATRNATELVAAIKDLEKLRLVRELSPLINSPLMVTMVVSVRFVENQALPRERARLYERCVEVLLRAQHQPDDRARDEVAEWGGPWDSQRDWLAHLAHDMHRQGAAGAAVSADEVARVLRPEVEEAELDLSRFLTAVRERGGLLEERGDLFQFLHLTFQEFLAARYIAKRREEGWTSLDEQLIDSWWREALLLIHGFVSIDDRKTANAYLAWLMTADRRPELRLAGLELAGTAILERERVTVADRQQVADAIAAALFDTLLRLPPEHSHRRAAAGSVLSALGDPRSDVLDPAKMAFCWVPPGPFWMGSDLSDELGFPGERVDGSARLADVPEGYWIGRYPVTQAQFQSFQEHPDYGAKRFWIWGTEGRDWQDKSGVDTHPVSRVSWHEALAFAAWTEEQLKAAGRLPIDWRIRLPSEVEWEKAARGGIQVPIGGDRHRLISSGDMTLVEPAAVPMAIQPMELAKRRYPWGDNPDPDRANYIETRVAGTGAVGCFPGGASVYGCEDMSGNVWEWTRSLRTYYPYPAPGAGRDKLEDLTGGTNRLLVLRGGSFGSARGEVRCAYRNWFVPYGQLWDSGLRLVASPFHSES
jgi:formylglycine-generating enzyme required for sulfatase activity/energy-coupling factor transporter ATP-binding protein EcfA2